MYFYVVFAPEMLIFFKLPMMHRAIVRSENVKSDVFRFSFCKKVYLCSRITNGGAPKQRAEIIPNYLIRIMPA